MNNKYWKIQTYDTYANITIEETTAPAVSTSTMVVNTTDRYLGVEIAEIIDETHIKSTKDEIYSIADDGKLTLVENYELETAPVYEQVTIDGKTIKDYSTYKAIDSDGNLYVWEKFTGGYSTSGSEKICTTSDEYIIEPIYSVTNGWTLIKSGY